MKTPCSRTWEAEAVGDGRLDPTARASFERHAATCEACREQLRVLARVSKAMCELPQYRSQAIDRRRQRIALIQRANEQLMRGRSRRLGISLFAAVGVCALVLALAGARWETRRGRTVAPVHTPSFEVVEVGNATWTTSAVGRTVRVALSVGTAAIHVEHLTYDQRFFVNLPDGELEVRGTRFQLNVADHRTTRVEVSEGVVVLRLVGRSEIVLTAGEQWTVPTPVAPTTDVARSVEPPPVSPSPAAPPLPSRRIARAQVPRVSIESVPDAPSPAADATARAEAVAVVDSYNVCIRAFESGDYANADRLLAAFTREHPSDARSEDAAFLRAVSHERIGDAVGAARLARDYLQRYPHGLRYREAQHLAETGEPTKP